MLSNLQYIVNQSHQASTPVVSGEGCCGLSRVLQGQGPWSFPLFLPVSLYVIITQLTPSSPNQDLLPCSSHPTLTQGVWGRLSQLKIQ